MNLLKPIFISFLLVCAALSSDAQKYSVSQGKPFTPPDVSKWGGFAGENNTSFFILRIRTRGSGTRYYIEKIDKSTREKKFEVELKLEEEAKVGLDPVSLDMRVMCSNEMVYVFFNGHVKKEKLNKYFVKMLHEDGTQGELSELASTKEKIDMNFYQSPDKSKIMTLDTRPWVDGHQVVDAIMYDAAAFKPLWHKSIPDNFHGGTMQTYYYQIDNSGGLYFLLNFLASKDPQVIGLGMGYMSAGSDKAKMLELPNNREERFTYKNGRALITADGKFVYTGVYDYKQGLDVEKMNEMTKKEKLKYEQSMKHEAGIFSYVVTADKSNVRLDQQPFNDEVQAKLGYTQYLLTAGAENKYYTASRLLEVGNEFYLVENHNYSISSGSTTISNYEREFMISKITPSGSIEWTHVYPKFTMNKLNTFNTMVNNGKLYLFYLDHPKNLDLSLTDYDPLKLKETGNYNGSMMVGLEVSKDGSAVRKSIFKNDGWCYDPQPYDILLEKDNSLLIRMINRDQERFDVLKIE